MMNADALDDIARQVATTPMSRRAAVKAVVTAMVAGPFLGTPRRPPSGGRLTLVGSALADASPECDWGGAGVDCAAVLAAVAACTVTCAKTITGCAGCLSTTVRNQAEKCVKKLNCHCATGEFCSSGWGAWGTCCQPPEYCNNPYGCQRPCGPCEKPGDYTGLCIDQCTNSKPTCCGATCTDTDTDPANCGECGYACYRGEICESGACACPAGLVLCNNQCVNTQTDPNNCGSCGNICPDAASLPQLHVTIPKPASRLMRSASSRSAFENVAHSQASGAQDFNCCGTQDGLPCSAPNGTCTCCFTTDLCCNPAGTDFTGPFCCPPGSECCVITTGFGLNECCTPPAKCVPGVGCRLPAHTGMCCAGVCC